MASPISISDVKYNLVGLDNWLAAAALSRHRYDDAAIVGRIPAMIRLFERDIQMRVNRVQMYSLPDGLYDTGSADMPAISADGYDYVEGMVESFFAIQLREKPIIQVQRVRLAISNSVVFTIPENWFVLDRKAGRFSIAPVSGALALGNLAAFNVLQMTFAQKGYLPNAIHIDYQAGLPDGWHNQIEWSDLRLNLAKYCALQVLKDIADTADAGFDQISVSGGSGGENLVYNRFEKRKAELERDVEQMKGLMIAQEAPFLMSFG